MSHPVGRHVESRYESVAEIDDQVRAALALNLSHACIQYKTARSDHLLKLSPDDAQIEVELCHSEAVDDETPTPDSCQLRRQTFLQQYLKIPDEVPETIWNTTCREFDEGLAIIEPLDSFQVSFQKRLRWFFRTQITCLALTKYRLLSRWHSLILDSEAVGKFGPLMRERLTALTMKFHDYNERILRLERAPNFTISDSIQYVSSAAETWNLVEHTEYFYIKLKWICREKQAELESAVDSIRNSPDYHESTSSMFIHREDKTIDNDMKTILFQLGLSSSPDLSNAHRLVGEIRSHIETVCRQTGDQSYRINVDDDEAGNSRPVLRKATWLDDLKQCFLITPSYEDAVQSRMLRTVATIDKVLWFECLSIEQQLDMSTLEARAADQAKVAVDLLNQEHTSASRRDSNVINEIPAIQKFQALNMARVALASKSEQKIVHRLNILRSIQRRLVIDAKGGFAMEDPLQLDRHKNGLEIPDSAGVRRFRPSELVSNLDTFMKYEGIQHRDDSYQNLDDDDEEFRVRDSDDVEIVYDVALDDWKALRKDLLMMATFFIMKLDASGADAQYGLDSNSKAPSGSSTLCDRLSILLDLYWCELEFQSAKCRLAFALLEAYEHAVDRASLNAIAQRIIHIINVRPRLDLTDVYFRSHYRLDTQIMLLEAEIVSEITHFQIVLQSKDLAYRQEDFRPLFPFGCPVGLFNVCTSTSTIANCLNSIRTCVSVFNDIWRRSHPVDIFKPTYFTQAIEMATLSAIRDSWKEHCAAFRHPVFPLSPFMEALRFDPLYTDIGKMSNRLATICQTMAHEGEDQLIKEQRVYLSYIRIFLAREQLLKCQFETDLLASIAAQQVRQILNNDVVPNIVGVRSGYTVAQAMGFPVETMHSACNREMFSESTSNGFLSIVSLQKIFCSGLRFLVEYHGNLGRINTALSKFDASLFPASRLISHGSLLSLNDIASSILERVRWKTSELTRLSRSKTEAYSDAINCQPDFLAGCLRTGLQTNGFLLDIIISCERLAANTDGLIPLGSSPFNTIHSPKSEAKSGDLFPHWLFDLTRGIALFRDVIIRNALPSDLSHEDIEKEASIYPILYSLCHSATEAQRLMGSSMANTSVISTGIGSDFVMAIVEDVISNLFPTGSDKAVALSHNHTLNVVHHSLQNLHIALRLFARHRADGIIQPLVDPDINNAVQHLALHLSVNDKDAEEEAELQLKRIFYRLNQVTPPGNRLKFAQAVATIVKLYDLVFSLRRFTPSNGDRSWVDIVQRILPAESSIETRQIFAEIIKQNVSGSRRLRQRRPDVFTVLGEDPSHDKLDSVTFSNTTAPSDVLSSPIVFFLLSQDVAELDRLQTVLQSAALLEMESLDVIEIRLKTHSRWDPAEVSRYPDLLPLRDLVHDLAKCSTDFVSDTNPESGDSGPRKKDFWIIAKSDLHLHLTRLGRSVVLNKRRMLSDLETSFEATQSALKQRLILMERKMRKYEHELAQQQAKAEWSINRGIIDSQFAVVLELERLKNRESGVKQRIAAMEKTIRDQVEREYQREIASLKAQLLMKESRFVQYKAELKKQVSSGITDVRRQAMMGIVDSKRVPFQTKRQALQEIRDFTEESIAEQERVDMQGTMVRMKTLFEMKELTLHSRLEAQIRKAQEKSDEANSLFEALEQSKQRERILLDQLIDEKNSVKLSRDSLHQLKHELEGCQKDRRNLLEWKAKTERQMAALRSDVEKYSELKSIDIDALISRLRKSEEALMRISAERSSKATRDESQTLLNKRIKQLEHGLVTEQKAKGDAIAQVLSLRNRIAELEHHLLDSNNKIEAIAVDLEKERRLNSDLVKETSGLHFLPFFAAGEQCPKSDSSSRQLRPQTSFVKKRAAVPRLQIAAKHAVFTARSHSSAKSRTASRN